MPRCIPTLGYRSRQEAIKALDGRGLSAARIAQLIGTSARNVEVVLCQLKSGRRRVGPGRTVVVATEVLDRIETHAAARGLTVNALVRLLLDHIADDDMVDAILDDGERHA